MSEQAPQNLDEWHEGKRTRISDVAKAQLVAQAMKPYEDESAALRYVTEKAMTRPYRAGYAKEGHIEFSDLSSNFEDGELSEDPLVKVHDWKHALAELTNTDGALDSLHLAPVEKITDQIANNNREADEAARVVADAYDELESTKR